MVEVEITIPLMNSFAYKYIQNVDEKKEKNAYTCRLSNKRMQQIQTNKEEEHDGKREK